MVSVSLYQLRDLFSSSAKQLPIRIRTQLASSSFSAEISSVPLLFHSLYLSQSSLSLSLSFFRPARCSEPFLNSNFRFFCSFANPFRFTGEWERDHHFSDASYCNCFLFLSNQFRSFFSIVARAHCALKLHFGSTSSLQPTDMTI